MGFVCINAKKAVLLCMNLRFSFPYGLFTLLLCCTMALPVSAHDHLDSMIVLTHGTDTLYWGFISEITIYPPLSFQNKQQERFYWRTVRDVKKTLPYAKMISQDMAVADRQLALFTDKKQRKQWWKSYEKFLFKKYEKDFRHMTASQGQMLMKLMDRESDKTSYELIYQYRGKSSADFWQFVAKLFKNDLKEGYDGQDKDRIIERVITLVEEGQL